MPPEAPAAASGTPLVSVGVPVRNGGELLRGALDSVLRQSYRHLEIVISDNASGDQTEALCRGVAAADPRVCYHRQAVPISGWANFRYVFEQSRGDYFLWAAHDDLRDANYVETLLRRAQRQPEAALIFSDLAECHGGHDGVVALRPYAFDTEKWPLRPALRRLYARHRYFEIYGLINAALLRDYSWRDLEDGPDVLLLTWLMARGPFVYEPGTTFRYYRPAEVKAREARAYYYLRRHGALIDERLAWAGAELVCTARGEPASLRRRYGLFLELYWSWLQGWPGLERRQPPAVRAVLRWLRRGYRLVVRAPARS